LPKKGLLCCHLPLKPFRYYEYGERTVHLDGCIEVKAAHSSTARLDCPPRPVQWNHS
jgi:hypothetical protein